MKKRYLTNEEREIYKRFLNLNDYAKIADHTGFSVSTVNNLVNQRQQLNKNTEPVLEALNVACYARMVEITKITVEQIKTYKALPEVKTYLNTKKQNRWI